MELTKSLPSALRAEVAAALEEWRGADGTRRLWDGDASLWTGDGEPEWLGWLDVVEKQMNRLDELRAAGREAREAGFRHALLLGMGGSSLCPEVLRQTFGRVEGFPDLQVLDSTDPARIHRAESCLDPARTLFIVASKSGTTLEPSILMRHFLERVGQAVGRAEAGRRFVAITDPGSALEREAVRSGFRRVFSGVPRIGGRYSALSDFGMVPAAILGVDVERLLEGAAAMADRCRPEVPAEENPGVALGILLGTAARRGRDKVTLMTTPGIRGLGAWLEQLLAESTGKRGRGLIPVDLEEPGSPRVYGDDRLFVHLRLEEDADDPRAEALDALEEAGHPVARLVVPDRHALGAEFFRWEVATAVAGSLLGINPFDQPDVEASKVATRELTSAYEKTGALPEERPFLEEEGVRLFAGPRNREALRDRAGDPPTLDGVLRAHLERLAPGDYFALLAYVEMSEPHRSALQAIRHQVRDARRVATCLGFGPRFLHSTGQVYKGGPDTGVFLQVTCEDAGDLPVPGRAYTFGVVKAAQARGDFQVLAERGRRLLRVHLGADVAAGLRALRRAVERALA